MTSEIKMTGYGHVNRYFLVMILILVSGFSFFLSLWLNFTPIETPNIISLHGINVFVPAINILREASLGIFALGIMYILIWWVKDKHRNTTSQRREDKKAVLSWILIFAFLVLVFRILPVAIGAGGSFKQLTNLFDLLGVLFALSIGIVRVLPVRYTQIRDNPRHRLHPQRIIDWFPAYSKILLLFSIGIAIFYRIVQGSTIGGITGDPDPFKIERMQSVAGGAWFIVILFIIIWRYNAPERTSPPALLTAVATKLRLIKI